MIDTINPINFDITKNLHGHVRVELRDRWTGRVVDSQEKDNLVTNAISEVLQLYKYFSGNNLFSLINPLYATLLGGLMLFDSTLTEAATNVRFPSSAKIVAIADQNADGTNVMGGSYNGAESVETSNGFSSVWDFATSQANGTISALARTHAKAKTYWLTTGDMLLNAKGYLTGTPLPLGYDKTNHVIYWGNYENICKQSWNPYTLGLKKGNIDTSANDVVATLTSSGDGTTTAYYYQYDRYANIFFNISSKTLRRIQMDGTRMSSVTLALPVNISVGAYQTCCATENYIWVCYNTRLFKISKSNYADITEITLPYSPSLLSENTGDSISAILIQSASRLMIVYPDNSIVNMTIGNVSSPISGGRGWIGGFLTSIQLNNFAMAPEANYLGTIANLDNPVTKSSSQTMKITYTLTEA